MLDWKQSYAKDKEAFTSLVVLFLQLWEAKNLFMIQGRNSSSQDVFLKAQSIHHDFRCIISFVRHCSLDI
ncbi:hypothetical protein ES319_A05G385900v1 [Gossypium barbadense]|uniref:Uncharacterized protein n=2 Tax=Gossypium TaxID=3633 RepID=A0A5J5VYI0_GOSBA|nr:hypothetical protein ES319_A05G385900v1 [Gossypium barbadense]TYH20178.1 hypothetical protein ES288_A05G410400v1 [Gossypium darwinii]